MKLFSKPNTIGFWDDQCGFKETREPEGLGSDDDAAAETEAPAESGSGSGLDDDAAAETEAPAESTAAAAATTSSNSYGALGPRIT